MSKAYIPERNHLVWLDFKPAKGREIGKYRPAFVLSSQDYNRKTGLVICCLVSSSLRGAVTEVPVSNLEKPSVIAANLVQTMAWRERKARFIAEAEAGVLENVLYRLLPLLGAERVMPD